MMRGERKGRAIEADLRFRKERRLVPFARAIVEFRAVPISCGGAMMRRAFWREDRPMFALLAVLALIVLVAGFRVAQQYERGVVLRFGSYVATKGPGLFWIVPLIDSVTKVDMRVVTSEVSGQEAISRDNVPIRIDAVIWRRVTVAERSVFEVRNIEEAVTQVAITILRDIIGRHTLDEILKEQASISAHMQTAIDAITEPWGVKVERVAMKSVEIPPTMQRAMAQEAEAFREKRARIIKAEAETEAAEKLRQAAETMMSSPAALELRRMQMLTEVGAEQNTMTIVMMPSEFVEAARAFAGRASGPDQPA
jgi:regulator of protease activity HflC (stomatin/prohibitin superfamily)